MTRVGENPAKGTDDERPDDERRDDDGDLEGLREGNASRDGRPVAPDHPDVIARDDGEQCGRLADAHVLACHGRRPSDRRSPYAEGREVDRGSRDRAGRPRCVLREARGMVRGARCAADWGRMNDRRRFWSKVDSMGPRAGRLGRCWVWKAATTGKGYGYVRLGGRMKRAHRIAWEWANGPIPDDLELDHRCRRRACVRPSHLRAVTRRVNLLAGDTIVARNARKLRCDHGHDLKGSNLYVDPKGKRKCRTCRRAVKRRAYARGKG
jgi:hypothetical protein